MIQPRGGERWGRKMVDDEEEGEVLAAENTEINNGRKIYGVMK